MPNPNPLNPICPHCGHYTTFNITLASGAKQYRCRRHTPNYTCTDSDRSVGRPLKGAEKLSNAERQRRHKANNLELYKAKRRKKKSLDDGLT